MVDRVRSLKIETQDKGSQNNQGPTEVNPQEDYGAYKGISFQEKIDRLIHLDQRSDVEVVGPFVADSQRLKVFTQNTTNSIRQLTREDYSVQVFEGTTEGQIVKLPDATLNGPGHFYEIWNFSTQPIIIQDFSGNVLAILKAKGQTKVLLRSNTTPAGVWGVTYTLDSGNVFGQSTYFASSDNETSNTSATTYQNKVLLTTPSLDMGDYLATFQFQWRAANANRSLNARLQANGVDFQNWSPYVTNVNEKPLISGFKKLDQLSGINNISLGFRVGAGSGTTVYMYNARIFLWRVK